MPFALSSPSFREGERIPKPYTCEGADVSPPLVVTSVPAGTQALALIVDDPDAPAGTWVHWVLYHLPADTRVLPEGLPKNERLDSGAMQGLNDFGRFGYGGPCPPPGSPHRYVFTLYALDEPITLPPRATKTQLERQMKGHLLGQAHLIGLYQR